MIHLDNISAPADQPHRLGGPIYERLNMHRLRSIAPSEMLEGTRNLDDSIGPDTYLIPFV